MATKYPKDARMGRQGMEFVARVATECGSVFRPFDTVDVGIDGVIEFMKDDETTGDLVLVQVKAGPSYVRGNRFVIPGDRDHFQLWARYSAPVVGIVCDPASGRARWVDISAHLRSHPERIDDGPYVIEAPGHQEFTAATFAAFASRFVRVPAPSTRVDVAPNLLIRPWRSADARPTRALLASVAPDYPDFYEWLEKQWPKAEVSKKVVEVDGKLAAYSMWTRKDARNVKLQTFIVGQLFRGTAVGQHLLYHELRIWAADPAIERVFVTVSSSKVELIDYFEQFGFRVEGISANRYPRASKAAELVLAKHFVRETVRDTRDVKRVFETIARSIWGLDPSVATNGRFGVTGEHCSVPTLFPGVQVRTDLREVTASSRVELLTAKGNILRQHDDASLMREFFPLRIHLRNKLYVIVPIYIQWVEAMLTGAGREATGKPTSLRLRFDNVYYCYPKLSRLTAGDLVIFYEPQQGGGSKSAIGCSVVRETLIDKPEVLYEKFSGIGTYELDHIRTHAEHAPQGRAMAIHFELFEPFKRRIPLAEVRRVLANATNVQGLTKITRDQFEELRHRGLS